FQTPVVRRGEVDKEGTLHGDLILVAQGDLSLGGRTGPNGELLFQDNDHSYAGGNPASTLVEADPLAGLDHLAREVYGAGIRWVTGEVTVEDRLFAPAASSGSGPSVVSPVVLNDNVVDVVLTPAAKPGEPATLATVPATPFLAIDAQIATIESGK